MKKLLPSILLLLTLTQVYAQGGNSYPCTLNDNFKTLDFWVGDWNVIAKNGMKAGENKIEKILKDCAIIENWMGSVGGEGKSLFYYDPGNDQWKQIWITQNTTRPGGLKEKFLLKEYEGPGVRFQGQYKGSNGGTILDRTTLTPIEDGTVRQLIEISTDNGNSWVATFDAIYSRK